MSSFENQMDYSYYAGATEEEKERTMWSDILYRALPHFEITSMLYNVWVTSDPEDQWNTKKALLNYINESNDVPDRLRTYRHALFLTEAFDAWTAVQNNFGACGTDTSILSFSYYYEHDLFRMVVLLQATLAGYIEDRKSAEILIELSSGSLPLKKRSGTFRKRASPPGPDEAGVGGKRIKSPAQAVLPSPYFGQGTGAPGSGYQNQLNLNPAMPALDPELSAIPIHELVPADFEVFERVMAEEAAIRRDLDSSGSWEFGVNDGEESLDLECLY